MGFLFLLFCFCFLNELAFFFGGLFFRVFDCPDMTFAVDWALKSNYLSIFVSCFVGFFCLFVFGGGGGCVVLFLFFSH